MVLNFKTILIFAVLFDASFQFKIEKVSTEKVPESSTEVPDLPEIETTTTKSDIVPIEDGEYEENIFWIPDLRDLDIPGRRRRPVLAEKEKEVTSGQGTISGSPDSKEDLSHKVTDTAEEKE